MKLNKVEMTVHEVEAMAKGGTLAVGRRGGSVVLVFGGKAYPVTPKDARALARTLIEIATAATLSELAGGDDDNGQ